MKYLTTLTYLVLFLGMASLTQSCTDACKDVTCLNNGVCNEGDCDCADGYEGSDCATFWRAKIIKSYAVEETCGSDIDSYNSTITAGSGGDLTIVITNFYNVDLDINGTMNGDRSFTIPEQTPENDEATVSGSGVLNADNTVTLTVVLDDGTGGIVNCTMVYTAS